jgi:riboflavin-specific deaminase-like protein
VAAGDPAAWVLWRRGAGWAAGGGWPAGTRDLLDLYLPVLPAHPQAAISVAHLGQSLDGYIATPGGESRFVTGPGNILHLHRMRALSDAVLAGAETVALDDPRLTTRLVAGDNPVRVVLDPRRRLGVDRQVFRDGAAPTLLVCAQGRQGPPARHGQAEVMAVPATRGRLDLAALVAGLHARGLRRLFVEGGGVSVSAFLAAGLLDRLQVTVAPLLIGEGRRGLSLPAPASLGECLRPPCRVFRMGEDVLFDCEPMRPGPARNPRATPAVARVR